jgi:hypothetical protein
VVNGISFFILIAAVATFDSRPEQAMAEFWWVNMNMLITSAAQIQVFQSPRRELSSSDSKPQTPGASGIDTIELTVSKTVSV